VNDSESGALKSCWDCLLHLAAVIRNFEGPVRFCSLRFGKNEAVRINSLLEPQKGTAGAAVIFGEDNAGIPFKNIQGCFVLRNYIHIAEIGDVRLPQQIIRLIKTYAPYCFAPLHAQSNQKAFAISHLAQSLDSRIATVSGDSKWIGSPDNLVHAHRMRALCDGVLIGARTLKKDRPRLTVRHVRGRNPTRIVIGSSIDYPNSLLDASPDPVVLIGVRRAFGDAKIDSIEMSRVNGLIPTSDILRELYRKGIMSVLIEGGSITLSRFIKENNIDILQLHISPMMIGKGLDSFLLPPVKSIAESYRFKTWRYVQQDEGIMFIGAFTQNG